MRPSIALQNHREAIREIALRHHVLDVRVFGSALHGNDTEESDLDLLVEPTADTTLFDIGAIRHELRMLLGIPVDVLTPGALPDSFKDRIMKEAAPV
ncbi:MAG: nucleotidyltransferase family protein [Nitrosomonadales bacterium]|nr:nucleotidyltransferase family protein [Nitrosomonadales bacterium]